MDKKILMLGLMLSGNVFGMNKLEVLNDYRNLSEQTKTEIVSKDQINDILTKFDLYKSETGIDLFSSDEKEEYDIQIKEDISDDIYAKRRHKKFMRDIEKGRLTSSYGYYYGEDEVAEPEIDYSNISERQVYNMVYDIACDSVVHGCNSTRIQKLSEDLTNIRMQNPERNFLNAIDDAIFTAYENYCSNADEINNFRIFKLMFGK